MEWITTNLPLIISALSLFVSIALVICFFVLRDDEPTSDQRFNEYVRKDNLSLDIIRRIKSNDSQLNNELQKMIEKYSSQPSRGEKNASQKTNTVTLSQDQVQKLVQIVTDDVLQLLRPDLEEFNRALDRLQSGEVYTQHVASSVRPEETLVATQMATGSILYASAANVDNGEFYTISEKSNEETILELRLNADGTKAEFEVFRGAEKMVLDTPDYLDGSCSVQRKGKSSVETNRRGEAVFSNGKWKVVKLAEVTLK